MGPSSSDGTIPNTNSNDKSGNRIPWLPAWLDLEIIVPVGATIVVLCVGVLVICVALTRRKQPQMTPGGTYINLDILSYTTFDNISYYLSAFSASF